MSVRAKVKVDLKGVFTKTARMTALGQYALAHQVHADSNMYAPKLSGDLRSQSYVTADNKHIIWNAPYARRQYYNYGARFTTPGTGPKWDSKALAIHGAKWVKITKAAMK